MAGIGLGRVEAENVLVRGENGSWGDPPELGDVGGLVLSNVRDGAIRAPGNGQIHQRFRLAVQT